MLTDRQRERCRELARALDSGDYATYKRAEAALTPEMRGEIWDQRAHVKTQTARAAKAGEVSGVYSPKPRGRASRQVWTSTIGPMTFRRIQTMAMATRTRRRSSVRSAKAKAAIIPAIRARSAAEAVAFR